MRVVLTCWGSLGDFYPFLALAARLKVMGHEPVLATSEFYRERTVDAGVEFHAVRPDIDPSDHEIIRRVMDPARGTEVLLRELLVPSIRQAFDDLKAVARDADLLVSHPVTFAGPLVAGSLRMRWLSVALAPTSFFSVHDFPLLPPHPNVVRLARMAPWTARAFLSIAGRITAPWTAPIEAFRRELGLPDSGDPLYAGQFSPFGTLALFSPFSGRPNRTGRRQPSPRGSCIRRKTPCCRKRSRRFSTRESGRSCSRSEARRLAPRGRFTWRASVQRNPSVVGLSCWRASIRGTGPLSFRNPS